MDNKINTLNFFLWMRFFSFVTYYLDDIGIRNAYRIVREATFGRKLLISYWSTTHYVFIGNELQIYKTAFHKDYNLIIHAYWHIVRYITICWVVSYVNITFHIMKNVVCLANLINSFRRLQKHIADAHIDNAKDNVLRSCGYIKMQLYDTI